MSITVSQLAAFDSSPYIQLANKCDAEAATVAQTAASLAQLAAAVRKALQGPAGDAAASQLETQSEQTASQSGHLGQAGTTTREVGSNVDRRQTELTNAQGTIGQIPQLALADSGHVTVARPDPNPAMGLYLNVMARVMTQVVRQTLLATDAEFLAGERALNWLDAEELHTSQTGPIDMDDESLQLAADTNSQGSRNDCVSLANLNALAQADPDFIREHMVWDPEAGVYHVTIYDRNTGQAIVVDVDPDNIAGGGAEAYRDVAPTWMSIYEEALRQQYPDLMNGSSYAEVARIITGQSADYRPTSFAEIQQTLGTTPPGVVVTGVPSDVSQPGDTPPENRVVPWHAYTVEGFDSQGRIILSNPWGPQGGFIGDTWYPGELHLTEEEYQQWFAGATRVEQPL